MTEKDLDAIEARVGSDDVRALLAHARALREGLTLRCSECDRDDLECDRPAVVTLSWSDRENHVCAEHVPHVVRGIALDHGYDRGGIQPGVQRLRQNTLLELPDPPTDLEDSIERACAAARAYLASVASGWRTETARLDDRQSTELLTAITEAFGSGRIAGEASPPVDTVSAGGAS